MSTHGAARAPILLLGTGFGNPELARLLVAEQYEVDTIEEIDAALEKIGSNHYHAIVLDADLPQDRLSNILDSAALVKTDPAVVLCTNTPALDCVRSVLRLGAHDLLRKPVDGATLVSALRGVLERRRALQELVSARQLLDVYGSLNDLEKTYSQLRHQIATLFQAGDCSLALLDVVRGEIVAQGPEYGSKADSIPTHRFRIAESRASKVILDTGEPFLTNALPEDPLFSPEIGERKVHNLLAVPMRTAAGIVGFIYVVNRPGGFSQLDAELLLALGQEVAVAVQSAHRFDAAYRQSITDPLTELYNRRFFDVRLKQEVDRAKRAGRQIALMFIDLDRFKQVNDSYGHQAGNLVLCEMARIIRQSCRSGDVPARWGGDEFCVLLTEVAAGSPVDVVARRIRAGISQTNWNPLPAVTVTMGISVMPQDAADLEGLMHTADAAMYLAKQRGRNTFALAQELPPAPKDLSQAPPERAQSAGQPG